MSEILNEDATAGGTSSGAIASVAIPLGKGEIVRRSVYGDDDPKKKSKKTQSEQFFA